jgi:N-acyl-D-amino-acid deacylase
MTHDLVIRDGTIVDGTGRASFTGDVAVDGERIVEMGEVSGGARRTIAADGALVTPGFVDIHTHLDAQLAWDPDATSSCWHGVTSVVLGNCGVTFAPVRPGQEGWLAALMESVEDIPAASILDGLAWDWETYGEYLSAVDRMAKGLNVGGMIGHCALRHYTMGERGLDDTPATADDIAAMTDLVDEAMTAGALGFSTSRTLLHRIPDGRFVPGTWADERELLAIADVLGRHGKGVYEVAPRFERPGANYEGTRTEVHWMAEINRRTQRPVTFGLAQSNAGPELFREILRLVDEEAETGGELRPQTTARGIGLLFGLQHRTFFDRSPEWAALQPLPRGSPRSRILTAGPSSCARPRATLPRSTGAGCTCSPPTRSTTPPTPTLRWPRTRRGPASPWWRLSSGSRARPAAGPCSTIRSSTSGWTRSRSCSTTPVWRSASATPAPTSA